jgi:hypothetical protein
MGVRRFGCGVACGLLLLGSTGVSATNDHPRERERGVGTVQKAFEITVRERANPLDPVIAVAGVLTLHVRESDGRFTGRITPGFHVPAGDPGAAGVRAESVLFALGDDGFAPVQGVRQLMVDGQFNGRGVNMVVHDVLGPGRDIFAQGTTEHFVGTAFTRDPGRIAGPGVGPLDGDRGDWAVTSETTCIRTVRLLPLQEDGSGGDVTEFTECIRIRSITLTPIP